MKKPNETTRCSASISLSEKLVKKFNVKLSYTQIINYPSNKKGVKQEECSNKLPTPHIILDNSTDHSSLNY
jgi:hypothetical protein